MEDVFGKDSSLDESDSDVKKANKKNTKQKTTGKNDLLKFKSVKNSLATTNKKELQKLLKKENDDLDKNNKNLKAKILIQKLFKNLGKTN